MMIVLLTAIQISTQAQQRYQLDVKSSKLQWKISTMGNHFGYLLFSSGILDYSAKREPLVGFFTMDMNNIRSTDGKKPQDITRVDNEIRSPKFFDVKKYPTATMKVKSIKKTEKLNYYNVTGDLTIRGITKPINFLARIQQTSNQVNIFAELKIDRTEWNIHHIPKPRTSDFFTVMKDKVMENEINIVLDLSLTKKH